MSIGNDESIELAGFEVVCRARDCRFNEHDACALHTPENPIIIGRGGGCRKYEEATATWDVRKKTGTSGI